MSEKMAYIYAKFSKVQLLFVGLMLYNYFCFVPVYSQLMKKETPNQDNENSQDYSIPIVTANDKLKISESILNKEEVSQNKDHEDGLLMKLQDTLTKLKPEIHQKSLVVEIEENVIHNEESSHPKIIDENNKEANLNKELKSNEIENNPVKISDQPPYKEIISDKEITNKDELSDINKPKEPVFKPSLNKSEAVKPLDSLLPTKILGSEEDDLIKTNEITTEININGTLVEALEVSEATSSIESNKRVVKGTSTSSDNSVNIESTPKSTIETGFILYESKQEITSRARRKKYNNNSTTDSPSSLSHHFTEAPNLRTIFLPKLGFSWSNESPFEIKNETFGFEETTTPNSVLEGIKDDNESTTSHDEKDQLEIYSQYAERVSAEKKSGAGTIHGTNGQSGKMKNKKNYASPDCGAKLLSANHESSLSHKIIQSNKDEYMLNKCTDKIWAVVDLCESIRPQRFDLANFELFSNLPKNIQLFGSHRYPTREWTSLGSFEGEEGNRDIQSFQIDSELFFKYIKLEVLSHFGTEFFCPISLFRIFGISEFEVIDQLEEPDEIVEEPIEDEKPKEKGGMIPTVIKSVFTGMLDVIKRGSMSNQNTTDSKQLNQTCICLQKKLEIAPKDCFMAASLNYILECYYQEYMKLMRNPFLSNTFQNSYFCAELANISCTMSDTLDSVVYDTICNNSYACVMLSPKHVLAMCHMYHPLLLHNYDNCSTLISGGNASHSTSSSGNVIPFKDRKVKLAYPEIEMEADEVSKVTSGADQLVTSFKNADASNSGGSSQVVDANGNSGSSKKIPQKKDKQNVPSSKSSNSTLNPTENIKPNVTTKEPKVGSEAIDSKLPPLNEDLIAPSSGERVVHTPNKESIVVRLSNKIKTLEQNMSISSQYLDELSRRYKRQMDEMHSQFNVTIRALNKTSQTAYERDLHHQNHIEMLENKLENLTTLVSQLVSDQDRLLNKIVGDHLVLLVVEVSILCVVFVACFRRKESRIPTVHHANGFVKNKSSITNSEMTASARRKSFTTTTADGTESIVKRSRRLSSDMNISGSYESLLITEEKRTRKKKSSLKRSESTHALKNRSHSSGPNRVHRDRPKRSSIAGVLFSGETQGAAAVQEINQSWHLVSNGRRGLRKKLEDDIGRENFGVKPFVDTDFYSGKVSRPPSPIIPDFASTIDYSGPVINDYYEAQRFQSNTLASSVNNLVATKDESPIKATPIWSAKERSFTKTNTLSEFPELGITNLSSTPYLKGAPMTVYNWISGDKPESSKQLFTSVSHRSSPDGSSVKFKLPVKGKKKKKSKSNK